MTEPQQPDREPSSELARALLAAGREEEPPPEVLSAAHDLVDERAPVAELEPPRVWWLAAAAGVLGIIAYGAIGEPEPVAAPTTADPGVQPTAEVPATTAVAAKPSPSPAPSAVASATASATAQPEVVATRPPRPKPAAGAGGPKAKPKAKPAAKTGACGCASDDLMCQMRCSSK